MNKTIFKKVVKQLEAEFKPLLDQLAKTDSSRAESLKKWLFEDLCGPNSTTNDKRVATCLAFETKIGLIKGEKIFVEVLNKQHPTKGYLINDKTLTNFIRPYHQFQEASTFKMPNDKDVNLGTIGDFYDTEEYVTKHPKDGYSRFQSFGGFHSKCMLTSREYDFLPLDPSDALNYIGWNDNLDKEMELEFPTIKSGEKVEMRGKKYLAWIMLEKEILEVLKKINLNQKVGYPYYGATKISKLLGLHIKESAVPEPACTDVFVLLHYKKNIPFKKAFHPSSIHADWDSGGFVPYYKEKKDCVGKTYDCYSKDEPNGLYERIHLGFKLEQNYDYKKDFSVSIVGRVLEAVTVNNEMALKESLDRFKTL